MDEDRAGDTPVVGIRGAAAFFTALGIVAPMGFDPFGEQEVGRDRQESFLAHFDHTFGERRDHGADDRRVGFLERLGNRAKTDFRELGLACRNVPEIAGQVVRRLTRPDIDDVIDGFDKHGIAVDAPDAERFGIGFKRARADAEDEPAFEQMIHHRCLRGDKNRVGMGQIGGAGAQFDLRGLCDQACLEQHRIGDAFGGVGHVFADIGFGIAQFIGQYDGLAVLFQALGIVLVQPVNRHCEKPDLHRLAPVCGRVRSNVRHL